MSSILWQWGLRGSLCFQELQNSCIHNVCRQIVSHIYIAVLCMCGWVVVVRESHTYLQNICFYMHPLLRRNEILYIVLYCFPFLSRPRSSLKILPHTALKYCCYEFKAKHSSSSGKRKFVRGWGVGQILSQRHEHLDRTKD